MSWTRRDFLGASALALLSGRIPGTFAPRGRAPGELVELRRNVGIFTARGGTIGWLHDPRGALLVDSQFPDTAGSCLAALRERGAAGVEALINTHHHADHTAGNGVIRPAARHIVAHQRATELQRRAAEGNDSAAAQVYADTTFEREWTLEVGEERVRAKHYGAAHTGGDCTVHFERAGVVHMGDLVFHRAFPFVDRAGGASVPGWIALLEAVAEEHPQDTLYLFGHARPGAAVTGSRADILLQRDFLVAVWERAERAVAQGQSREEATALEVLPGFPDHVALVEWLNLAAPLGAAYDEAREGR